MNFDRKHEFHRRIKSHSMRVIIMIDVVTCVYIKTQPETYIYIYYTYLPSPHHFLLSCLFSCFMAISYGQWLFWIWIGGIGLTMFKCGEWCALAALHKPDWPDWYWDIYHWYWGRVMKFGLLLIKQSRMRIGQISPVLSCGPYSG